MKLQRLLAELDSCRRALAFYVGRVNDNNPNAHANAALAKILDRVCETVQEVIKELIDYKLQ